MALKADAAVLAEPLQGGVNGAAVSVEPMNTGTATFPPGFFLRPEGRFAALKAFGVGVSRKDYTRVPVPAFLIRHPGVGPILVDTGLHGSVASDPKQAMGRMQASYFEQEHGQDVVSQLRAKKISANEISVVIMTHLHGDHASAMSEFAGATFVVSASEWRAVNELRVPMLKGYVRRHYDLGVDFRLVDFNDALTDSYGPLGHTWDLFGDGSVRLASTPGHTPGHMSVIVRLPQRDFVMAGDAMYSWGQLTGEEGQPYWLDDEHFWKRSVSELRRYHEAYPHAVIVPSHDGELFGQLAERYDE